MRSLFRNRGIYTRYVTSYRLTVNFPDDGFWAALDGENKTGRSVSFEAMGVEHRLEAALYRTTGGTRLAFSAWSDGVADNPRVIRLNRDTVLNAVYRVEHHVAVSSEIGEASGEGWYVEGSTATVSVTPSIIPKDFFTNHVFEGWVENGR
jgi:predicted ATPase